MLQGELNSLFLDPRTFLFFLDKELACAERYNHYVSVLLLEPEGLSKSKQDSSLDRLAQALASHVRKSDSVGSIKQGTLGIILSHTSIDGAGVVLERLKFEAMCLSGGPQKARLKASCAVFPSEANSLESLCDLAIQRLAGDD
jgi:GGDEF domain-containing protein